MFERLQSFMQLVRAELGLGVSDDPRAVALASARAGADAADLAGVQADLTQAYLLRDAVPPRGTTAELMRALKPGRGPEWEPRGFGVRLAAAYGGGETVSVLTHVIEADGQVAAVDVRLQGRDATSWARLRPWVAEVLGPDFTEVTRGFQSEFTSPAGARAMVEVLARALGERPAVEVPEPLRAAHALLTSPTEALRFAPGDHAHQAAQALAAAGRPDLLRDALRGPNPVGRILAADALLKQGAAAEDVAALRAVRALDLEVESQLPGAAPGPCQAAALLPEV